DGPASFRLLPHQPFGPHIDTYGRRARAGPTATDRRENPDSAWARSPVGVLTYASPSESSTWPGRELYHTSPGPYASAARGLGNRMGGFKMRFPARSSVA